MRALIAGLASWLVLLPIGLTRCLAQRITEPSYDGRPLSYWVGALQEKPKNEHQLARRRALAALTAIGKPAVPALVELLKNKDGDVRNWATTALGKIRPFTSESIKGLIGALDDGDEGVRAVAALFIGEIGTPAQFLAGDKRDPGGDNHGLRAVDPLKHRFRFAGDTWQRPAAVITASPDVHDRQTTPRPADDRWTWEKAYPTRRTPGLAA